MNLWGTFLPFITSLRRAGDLLEYRFLLSTDTEGGDGVALVARAWGWEGRRGPAAVGGEMPWLRPQHGRDSGDEQKRCWCLTLAGVGKGLHSRA